MKTFSLMTFVWALGLTIQILAQDRVVSGKITSAEDGSTLPGVSIKLKGTARSTTADAYGIYKISVPNGAVLAFSYPNMVSKEIAIGARTIIDVQLQSDDANLEEPLIMGYGQQAKKIITGLQGQVSGDDIAKKNMVTVRDALQAGMQMLSLSGQLGAN